MKFRGFEKASKNLKRKVNNIIKIAAIILTGGAGGSEKSSDFGGDTFEPRDESILTDQRPELEDQWEMSLESENLLNHVNEARVFCKMITDEVQWQKMKKELISSHNYSRLGMLEIIRGHLIRYFSPGNSKANPAIPKPQTTENIASPEITEINFTVKCESVDPVLHIVLKPNGSKISFGEDAREEIPDETQCDDLGKCKTVIKSSIDFKSISRNRVGDEVLVEDRTNSKSALRNLLDLVMIQGSCKMYKNNEILDIACHDGNENGDTDKSSSQQTQCQNTDTNTAGASYQQAPGNHGMSTLSGGSRDDDGDEENPGRAKKDERIGGCASSEVGETDKKQNANANNNRPQGDQAMPDQSLLSAECSDVSQGAAGYERPQSPRSYSSLGPREYSYSSSENEDEILVVDANHCDGHMEALNDDNVVPQLEVPVNGEMEHFEFHPGKDFFDQRIYQDENPLRLSTYHDQAQGFVRKSDVDCRPGKKPFRPPDTRQEGGRQIPPSGINLGLTPVQHTPWIHEPPGRLDPSSPPVLPHAPWSHEPPGCSNPSSPPVLPHAPWTHEPPGCLNPSSPPVLPHTQLEGFLSQDGNEDEEQIPSSGISLGQTPVQHAPDSHEHPGSLDSSSSLVLPHRQMDNPPQGSQANEGFVLQDGNAAEGAFPEQTDDHGWIAVEHSSSGQCVAREIDLEFSQEIRASRPDELRVDRTFQHPAENCRRVIRTCFSCNMPHMMSQDQNDSCNYCGRFFCLDHFDSHVCIVPRFIEEEEAPEDMDFDDHID